MCACGAACASGPRAEVGVAGLVELHQVALRVAQDLALLVARRLARGALPLHTQRAGAHAFLDVRPREKLLHGPLAGVEVLGQPGLVHGALPIGVAHAFHVCQHGAQAAVAARQHALHPQPLRAVDLEDHALRPQRLPQIVHAALDHIERIHRGPLERGVALGHVRRDAALHFAARRVLVQPVLHLQRQIHDALHVFLGLAGQAAHVVQLDRLPAHAPDQLGAGQNLVLVQVLVDHVAHAL